MIMPSDSVAMNSASFLSIRRRKLQHNCLNVSKKRLQHIAPQKEIGFSSGIYAMKENDTLHDAYKASDERLYVNKQNKNSRS
ncbi:Putative two-component response regulator and GGDEF family protein YeaJ [Escherichia coli ISC7]|uniref:Two-component response regulator and GGDEF family protein YeaJ n=1 Tax=Escherichia coli ISC7 TaxID=1432555 RepID=W1EV05_ECOLX|nr:Putative two-component response regulator and GGDEF family protein YeaJ [Escherichia coli ISC7]